MLNIFNSAYACLPLALLPKPAWVCKKARPGSNLIAPRTKENPARARDSDEDDDGFRMDTSRKKRLLPKARVKNRRNPGVLFYLLPSSRSTRDASGIQIRATLRENERRNGRREKRAAWN